MPSLHEIAAATGLSPSTISRVLRGHGDVSEATRQQVQKELRRLGYPQGGRFSRRGRPSKVSRKAVVAVVCSEHAAVRKNPFFAPILSAALECGAELGLRAEPIDWPDHAAQPPDLDAVNGAVFIETQLAHIKAYAQKNIAATVDAFHPSSGADGVIADYRSGIFDCVARLLAKGHRRIALLSAARGGGDGFFQQVYDGARRALDLEGVDPGPNFVAGQATTPSEGYAIAQKLLAKPAGERPTALFGSDHPMLGALRAAHDLGLRVPQDVAVAGVDDIELGQFSVPRLSTVRVQKELLGQLAVERVLWRMTHPRTPVIRILLECPYIERDTC
ncbi:MAG: LacI family DNA-binding transcriptional regulator [Planctomycetota bacterium]|nr:LacI family DNA-binding transcriptional regulator [Planctomycetota bacterium]